MNNINIYDMLVFEDESGSIYQDCVCSVSNHQYIIECNEFYIYQDSLNIRIGNDKHKERQFKLKEIWTRTDEDTYKKVWELVDGELTKISYSQGMKVYHRRQEVTYDQIKKFIVKGEESMGE